MKTGETKTFENLFVREIERNDDSTLVINQCEVGDVGCVVWDAAIALSKYFEGKDFQNGEFWKGKKVVEVGAGTGVVGLMAASYGAKTVITDLEDFVPLMDLNIATNRDQFNMAIEAKELKWGSDVSGQICFMNVDVVIAADCIYYDESLEPLVTTLIDLCGPNTCVYCCYEERTTGNKPELQRKFLQLVDERFSIEKIPLDRQDPLFSSDDIHILKMKRKT